MGMFGARSAAQQVAAGGDGMDPSTAKPRFFDQGGAGRPIAGYIGDALLNMSGNKPVYAPMMQQQRQQQAELARMMQMAQWKQANPDPTGTMQNAQAAGAMPGTPEYQALIKQTMLAPHYITLGSPETGQQVIDANNPPPQQDAGPPPEAVAHLKSNPALAAQFDEVFGPGSAARVMGSQ